MKKNTRSNAVRLPITKQTTIEQHGCTIPRQPFNKDARDACNEWLTAQTIQQKTDRCHIVSSKTISTVASTNEHAQHCALHNQIHETPRPSYFSNTNHVVADRQREGSAMGTEDMRCYFQQSRSIPTTVRTGYAATNTNALNNIRLGDSRSNRSIGNHLDPNFCKNSDGSYSGTPRSLLAFSSGLGTLQRNGIGHEGRIRTSGLDSHNSNKPIGSVDISELSPKTKKVYSP